MSLKRTDLQGIRGIAILLVLSFHLKPNYFPFGFIGVDMFFVLSGYLMTMILSKKTISFVGIHDFYRRRFKRIVPLYTVILTGVYLVCWYFVVAVDRLQLLIDLKWSLSFSSNIQPLFEEKGYWDQVTSYRFFVHCWSLGVEIQFYVIAPLLIGYCRQKKWWGNTFLLLVLNLSLVFQLFAPPKLSYGLLSSRIWQFLYGTVAFDIEERVRSRANNYEVLSYTVKLLPESVCLDEPTPTYALFDCSILRELILVIIVLIVWMNPEILGQTSVRLLGTFLTALFICLPYKRASILAESRLLVYFGGISYTLYLVHWPVIVLYKYYYSLDNLDLRESSLCVLNIFSLTIVIHHTLENYLLTATLRSSILIFLASISIILLTSSFYQNDIHFNWGQLKDSNETAKIERAIKYNTYESSKVYYTQPCEPDDTTVKWTNYTTEPKLRCQTQGNGSLNVLVMGNSIAYRAFPLIHEIFKGRYNTLRLYSRSSVAAIVSSTDDGILFEKAVRKTVEMMKPDVIFIIYAVDESGDAAKLMTPVLNWKNDTGMLQLQRNFDFHSKYASRIVLDLPYFINRGYPYASEIIKRLKLRKPLTDLKVTKEDLYKQQHWQHERLRHIICPKCILNDVNEALFYGGTFYMYDKSTYFAYSMDGSHFTPAGLELLRGKYTEVIENLLVTTKPKSQEELDKIK